MRKFDDKELSKRVDEVLFYVWDPIGVANEPCARSEYENYVPKICQLVEQNDNISPISSHLANIVKDWMGKLAIVFSKKSKGVVLGIVIFLIQM